MARKKLTIADAGVIAAALPGVVEGTSYGTRGWKVGKKFLMREKERMDHVLVVKLANVDEQDFMIARDPEVFFITDHYRGWPAVLVRLDRIDRKSLTALIEQAWRAQATRKLIVERDG